MLQNKRQRVESDATVNEAPVRKCPHLMSVKTDQVAIKEEEIDDKLETEELTNAVQENGIGNLDCSDLNDEEISSCPGIQTDESGSFNGFNHEDEDNNDEDRTKSENALKLNGFDVLDDLGSNNEEDENGYERNCYEDLDDDPDWSTDKDIPQDEIEAMLKEVSDQQGAGCTSEEADKNDDKGSTQKDKSDEPKGAIYDEIMKTVLEELDINHFDVLPEGWVQVTHNSGMPVYLHRASRVCSMSKPYFLGPGSARKHEVPLSAIPCLQYKRALEAEEAAKQKSQLEAENNEQGANGTGLPVPHAHIETAQENKEAQSLTTAQVNEYCSSRFNFKSKTVRRFRTWSDRRKYIEQQRQLQRPTLPEGTNLIKFPVHNAQGINGPNGNNRGNTEWIVNPNGKSYVSILQEYVQQSLRTQPSYQFKELENAATPYSATVTIKVSNDILMQYGVGYGTNKKQAKSNAAKATLEIMIPDMREKIEEDSQVGSQGTSKGQDSDLSYFDCIMIEDPRVAELCAKATEPLPYEILATCLQMNRGKDKMIIKYTVNTVHNQKNQITMTVGQHTVTLPCQNKREGKQLGAQRILQLLHPQINNWGSLLRLYGNRFIKKKKQEEQEIMLLLNRPAIDRPNYALPEKLRSEMLNLKMRKENVQVIGRFEPDNLPTGNGADLNNVDL